jgi:hypothetical protein
MFMIFCKMCDLGELKNATGDRWPYQKCEQIKSDVKHWQHAEEEGRNACLGLGVGDEPHHGAFQFDPVATS